MLPLSASRLCTTVALSSDGLRCFGTCYCWPPACPVPGCLRVSPPRRPHPTRRQLSPDAVRDWTTVSLAVASAVYGGLRLRHVAWIRLALIVCSPLRVGKSRVESLSCTADSRPHCAAHSRVHPAHRYPRRPTTVPAVRLSANPAAQTSLHTCKAVHVPDTRSRTSRGGSSARLYTPCRERNRDSLSGGLFLRLPNLRSC